MDHSYMTGFTYTEPHGEGGILFSPKTERVDKMVACSAGQDNLPISDCWTICLVLGPILFMC